MPRTPISHYILSVLFAVNLLPTITLAAFTQPTSYGRNYVEQNSEGTWCYYPEGNNRNVEVSCTGRSAEFLSVLEVHLNQTVSIGYYSAANILYGGPEWPVDRTRGRINLCMSGRAGDGKYKTICEQAFDDNDFGGVVNCALEVAQRVVTDGCYVPPGQTPVDEPNVPGPEQGPQPGTGQGPTPPTGSSALIMHSANVWRSLLVVVPFIVGLLYTAVY